ncbi:hypothetical protein ACEQ8H_002132 [Pleosporales sp. CAS-2024a]
MSYEASMQADRRIGSHAPLEDLSMNETVATDHNDDNDAHAPTNAPPVKAPKKRARKNETAKDQKGVHVRNQASLEHFTRPEQHMGQAVPDRSLELTLGEDPNSGRKKRRRTASLPANTPTTIATSMQPVEGESEALLRASSPTHGMIASFEFAPAADADVAGLQDKNVTVTPKKQIRVTKSGKLVSSPPKPTLQEPMTTQKKRRGRPPKAKVLPTVTIIKYGADAASRHALGGRIDAILAGIGSTTKQSTSARSKPCKSVEPPKSTHPFFLGKPVQKTETPTQSAIPPTPRKSAVTPGKLRAETRKDDSPTAMPTFGASSGTTRITKQAGLFEAVWPTREMSHVRNLETAPDYYVDIRPPGSLPIRARKMKNRVVNLDQDEEIISRLARDIVVDIGPVHEEEKFAFQPPEDVRLPMRLLTTGNDIQQRVLERLQTLRRHPAVESLFRDIEHTLTPFDEGRCEAQAWVQKYSPTCASHVLSEDTDALVLKDWLQSLTVMSVGGAHESAKVDGMDAKRPPKKKRKKAADDFIVFDDDEEEEEEEEEEMVEVPGREGTSHARSYRRPQWIRNNNVIVVSGPHGCGKSATVYAVAKELGFEIFEINSGTRRSGKDIQDKVGDMTANHLVNHDRVEAGAKEPYSVYTDNDTDRMDTALQKDIDSGRQGTMMSFFKSNAATIAKQKAKPKTLEAKSTLADKQSSMQPRLNVAQKSQKQSLILFEEADILFEEDQQFWAQVTKLAAHSKRPIIITCNDEGQIPFHDLPVAAILRLRPPPVELATDYMLVLAGREGHVLEREAVRCLYQAKHHDLRASIMELDLWCQMSVGDRKGGLEWMYQRWPPGQDVDAQGRLLRVASENTYQAGMGWLSHNVFETTMNTMFDKEEELLNEVWTDWGIDPSTWTASSSHDTQPTQPRSSTDLEELDQFMDTLSAADIFCRVGLPSYDHDFDQPADPTLPPIVDKTRLSYTLAAPLLQADEQTDFLQLDTAIRTQTELVVRRTFPKLANIVSASASQRPRTENDYTEAILRIRDAKSRKPGLSRLDFSCAMDCLAAAPDQILPERTSFILTPSSFDRTFNIITLDLAPYVRSIVAHEQILETQRLRLSNLVTAGGNGKRARTTRASRVALEGGVRESKRRDRWFEADVNFEAVMATAGRDWSGMGWRSEDEPMEEGLASMTGTQESLTGSQEVHDA